MAAVYELDYYTRNNFLMTNIPWLIISRKIINNIVLRTEYTKHLLRLLK